jgi:DNA-binding PadR family transcriptional regulator
VKLQKPKAKKQKSNLKQAAPHEPIGWLKAKILKQLALLGEKQATGHNVLEILMKETGDWVDPGSVYGGIRMMAAEGLVEHVNWLPPTDRGPPMKLYKVTEAGHERLKATAEFHRRLGEYLGHPKEGSEEDS